MFIVEGLRSTGAADSGASPWVLVGDRLGFTVLGFRV